MNIDQIRNELPALNQRLYFNAGTCGPLPVSVIERVKENLVEQLRYGRADSEYFERLAITREECKSMISSMIQCQPEEISLTSSTTEGLNMVINGLDWQAGDEIITTNAEHPSGYSPLFNLRHKGIKIHFLDVIQGFDSILDQFQQLLSSRVKLLSVSHVIYCTGDKLPARELANLASRHDVPVLLDGAQAFGATALDMKSLNCDFYAAPGQKWLCGPEGTGFLYIKAQSRHRIKPVFTSYNSIKNMELYEKVEYEKDGRAFEATTLQPAALAGMLEALRWTRSIGLEEKEKRNKALSAFAWELLKKNPNVSVINNHRPENLISFHTKSLESREVALRLWQKGIVVRPVPITEATRISVGFYNTEEEIEQIDHCLKLW